MDELRKQLDDEARWVEARPDALEAMRRRAGRRRVTRQIGTSTLALAIAGGGLALAWNAFSGRPTGRPLAGPSGSISPTPDPRDPRYQDILNFVDLFLEARDALDAEHFLSPEAREDYFGTDPEQPAPADLHLYSEGGISFNHRLAKFDKFEAGIWIVEVSMEFGPIRDCPARRVVERLVIEAVPPERIVGGAEGALLVTSAELVEAQICPVPDDAVVPTVGDAPAAVRDLQQGGMYWGVFIVVSQDQGYIRRVADRMAEQGVPVSSGTIACDHGAAEVLGVPGDSLAVTVYFEHRQEAELFADALSPRSFPYGIVRVQTYCED